MVRSWRLSVYMTAYLCVCLVGNLCLVIVFLCSQWSTNPSLLLHPQPAVRALDISSGWSPSCSDLSSFSNFTVIGSGWTKIVYRSEYDGLEVAVKMVHTTGHDMTDCTDTPSVCYQKCADKILKEIQLLRAMAHPNVIKVYGECVPKVAYSVDTPSTGAVAAVMELGRPVSILELLQMNFDQRLKLARDVGQLLQHLSTSSLGPVLMKDFRREQFVLVGDSLKLSDVDDVVIGDPSCFNSTKCPLKDPATEAVLVNVPCVGGICRGFNSRHNALQAGQHFLRLLLPYDGPPPLEAPAMDLMARLAQGLEDSDGLHRSIENLVDNYTAGNYLTTYQRDKIHEYIVSEGLKVDGSDFICSKTELSMCRQSVASAEEAAWLCWQWPQCVAFVLLHQWTWTGRQIAVFKAGVSEVEESQETTLYIHRGRS